MYKYVPFEEIDKNRWNGTVHYSPNGNLFGHYWFLKSVYKQWDAIVEDNYQSVFPLLPLDEVTHLRFTPELGPYSVNAMTVDRCSEFIQQVQEHTGHHFYPINDRSHPTAIEKLPREIFDYQQLHLIDDYETIANLYSQEAKDIMHNIESQDIILTSGVKPETIVAQSGLPMADQIVLQRLMYNAMHRGTGWSLGIKDKKTDKFLALNYYITSHNVIHEIYSLETRSNKHSLYLLDMLLRKSAGKPSLLKTYRKFTDMKHMGFTMESHQHVRVGERVTRSWFNKLLGRTKE